MALPHKRLGQLIPHRVCALFIHCIYAIANFVSTLIDKSAEHSVPERKYIAVVAVGPGHGGVMVKLVCVGRYDDIAQCAVNALRQGNIRVRKVGTKNGD